VLPELVYFNHLVRMLRQRIAEVRHDERGMTTETVIITAVLAALALAVGAIIVAKVTSKANSIPTGQ
jgi:hypothetical protein